MDSWHHSVYPNGICILRSAFLLVKQTENPNGNINLGSAMQLLPVSICY